MSTAAIILEDNSTLSFIDRQLFKLETSFALVSGITVLGLMFLAVISAGGRNFFNSPLPGYVDWIEFTMPLIAIFGIAFCQRQGGHIRTDILIGYFKGRLLWSIEWISTLLILLFIILLTWGSWAHFLRSFEWGAPLLSRDSSLDIGLPLWPAKLIVPIAFGILSLRLILHLWGYGLAFITNKENPVAVPLMVNVTTQAVQETQAYS